MTRTVESLVAVHTHTSRLLINNNILKIIKKIVIRA